MNIGVAVSDLKVGDRLQTVEGSVAEVLEPSVDGSWIRVKYVGGSPGVQGAEDLVSGEDIIRILRGKDCLAIAHNAGGEALFCVLAQSHEGPHVWRNAECSHAEADERAGACEHDHDPGQLQ